MLHRIGSSLIFFGSCVDKFTGRNIRKKLCGRKPSSVGKNSRKCNTFGCDFRSVATVFLGGLQFAARSSQK